MLYTHKSFPFINSFLFTSNPINNYLQYIKQERLSSYSQKIYKNLPDHKNYLSINRCPPLIRSQLMPIHKKLFTYKSCRPISSWKVVLQYFVAQKKTVTPFSYSFMKRDIRIQIFMRIFTNKCKSPIINDINWPTHKFWSTIKWYLFFLAHKNWNSIESCQSIKSCLPVKISNPYLPINVAHPCL